MRVETGGAPQLRIHLQRLSGEFIVYGQRRYVIDSLAYNDQVGRNPLACDKRIRH